jgi:hypothetical protein
MAAGRRGRAHSHGDGHHHHDAPKTWSRTALLLILGSSPMVEGIPAFFAAGRYGFGLIATMSAVSPPPPSSPMSSSALAHSPASSASA